MKFWEAMKALDEGKKVTLEGATTYIVLNRDTGCLEGNHSKNWTAVFGGEEFMNDNWILWEKNKRDIRRSDMKSLIEAGLKCLEIIKKDMEQRIYNE